MSNTTRSHLSAASSSPKHPTWCTPSESCKEFSQFAHALHVGPVESLTLEGITGDWESNPATVTASLQTIECTDGTRITGIELAIDSETGSLELDPVKMRVLAEWLFSTADRFEGVFHNGDL